MIAILWLLILSDGVAAAIGARAAWRMRIDNARPELATAFGVGLTLYSLASFGLVCNSVINGGSLAPAKAYLGWAICFRAIQSLGVWSIALTLLNGSPGVIRRTLYKLLRKL